MRVKDDGVNSFLAGFATSVVLGANGNDLAIFSNEEKGTVLVRCRRWIHDVRFLQGVQMVWILIFKLIIFLLRNQQQHMFSDHHLRIISKRSNGKRNKILKKMRNEIARRF